jgi:proline-rich protein PRCC
VVKQAAVPLGEISDEEEEYFGGSADDGFDLITEAEPDLFSLIAQKLPNAKIKKTELKIKEDEGDIPEKKDYGDKVEEPPAKKKKRDGPVKITIPSLNQFVEEEDQAQPSVTVEPSQGGSGLFALLPQPKHRLSKPIRSGSGPSPILSSVSGDSKSLQGRHNLNNLKPQGVRTVGLVPHRVANPSKPKPAAVTARAPRSDSDDDDDYLGMGSSSSSSYFPATGAAVSSKYKLVNPTPLGPATPHRSFAPSLPSDPSFVSLNMADDVISTGTPYEDLELGPAVAPYPPPAPTYPEPSDSLIDNQEAINRLAGKANKRKDFKEDFNIIDINEDDMKGDPRVWLTKAMTEEQAPRPSGKGPKGLAKTRHQITYLAHQAKERDWELKQEWASARENRNASRNKYGFC